MKATAKRKSNPRRTLGLAESSPHLNALSLEALRSYRQRLMDEEDKISYWRRLAHARIDLLEAGAARDEGMLSMAQLVKVLGDTAVGHRRRALLDVRPAQPLPDLPVLDEVWVAAMDPHDGRAINDAIERLRAAERQLTEYRRALHARIDEATGELIVRYRADLSSTSVAFPTHWVRPGA